MSHKAYPENSMILVFVSFNNRLTQLFYSLKFMLRRGTSTAVSAMQPYSLDTTSMDQSS